MFRILWTALTVLAITTLPAFVGRAEDVTRYIRFAVPGSEAHGIFEGGRIHELVGDLFESPKRTGRTYALADVKVLTPTVPSKVIAVALNYRSHAGESGAAKPELFAKLPSSLIATKEPILVPADATNLHYEGELVIVIGKKARRVSVAEAPAHIFGVTAGNDVSERTWQFSDRQWLRAKASDGFGPVGPVIVTGLDYGDLLIETRLNGEVQQAESTKNLIHGVDKIVSFASQYFTLLPGDLIFTGTPGQTRAMQAGDVVEVKIQGIGILSNRVVAGDVSE